MSRLQRRPRDCRVAYNDRIHAVVNRGPHDLVRLTFAKVGGDLQEDRRPMLGTRLANRREQGLESSFILELAKPGRVWRADVDREVPRNRCHGAHAAHIIGDAIDTVLVRADVDANHPGKPQIELQASIGGWLTAVVEAHAVDDSPVFAQPEQPRTRIALLRPWSQRADLDKAEAEREHLLRHLGVLVEARSKANRG